MQTKEFVMNNSLLFIMSLFQDAFCKLKAMSSFLHTQCIGWTVHLGEKYLNCDPDFLTNYGFRSELQKMTIKRGKISVAPEAQESFHFLSE